MNMFQGLKKNKAHQAQLFALLNGVLFFILGTPLLLKTLDSPALYYSANQHFTSTSSQTFIWLSNIIIYFCYINILPVLLGLIFKVRYFHITWLWLISFCFITLLLILDVSVFGLFHFHLNGQTLRLFLHRELPQVLSLSSSEFISIFFVVALVLAFEYLLLVASKKLSSYSSANSIPSLYFLLWLVSMISTISLLAQTTTRQNNIFSQHLSNLPLALQAYKLIAPASANPVLNRHNGNFYEAPPAAKFNYPKSPLRCEPPKQLPNIVLIGIDTLRFDAVTPNNMPNLYQFTQPSLQFKNHYSGGNATQTGLFSLFYSIPSNNWYSALNHKQPPVFLKKLKALGYHQKIIWATNMRHPKVTKTLYLGVDGLRMDAAPGADPLAWDKDITQQAIHFLKQKKTHPYFLHLFYHSPHAFCRTTLFDEYFTPYIKLCHRITLNNDTDPIPYRNRYLNVIKSLDHQLAPLLTLMSEPSLRENTIIIITSDHGQEFNENHQNFWGHTSNYSQYQLQVPLFVLWPGKEKQLIFQQTSHYDIVPTLMQTLLRCKNPTSDYSIGHNLFNTGKASPLIAGSYTDMAYIKDNKIYVFKTTGEVKVFDLKLKPIPESIPDDIVKEFINLTQRYTRAT